MTDEEYIEKLMNHGFEYSQINQLLKIYVYTKETGLDLSGIDLSVSDEYLRNFAQALKEGKIKHRFLQILNNAIERGLNVTKYINSNFKVDCLEVLIEFEKKGFDPTLLCDPDFNIDQLHILMSAKARSLDISKIANPKYGVDKIKIFCDALDNNVNLADYIDVDIYSARQMQTISGIFLMKYPYPINLDIILDPNYSPTKMELLAKAMGKGIDIRYLEEDHPDDNLDYIFNALLLDFDDKYINIFRNNNFTKKQLECIFNFIEKHFLDEDDEIKKLLTKYKIDLFDEKYNWAILETFFNYLEDDDFDICLFESLLDKDYSFEQIHELIAGKHAGLDNEQIDILRSINEVSNLHFTKRMFEMQNQGKNVDKYLDFKKDIDTRISEFIKDRFDEEIVPEEEKRKPPKYLISCEYDRMSQYFLTENSIVEIAYEYETPYYEDEFYFGQMVDDESEYYEAFFKNNEDEFYDVIKNFFVITYNPKDDTLSSYDIKKKKEIEHDIEDNTSDIIYEYLDEEIFYESFMESILYTISEEDSDQYVSPFENFEEMVHYGAPNINNQLFIDEVRETYCETYTICADLEMIRKEFGDISKESIKKAKLAFKDTLQDFEDLVEGRVFYYKEYDLKGNEIDGCGGFIGDYAIDDIEANIGTFVKELGNFVNIDECLEAINEQIEEEER